MTVSVSRTLPVPEAGGLPDHVTFFTATTWHCNLGCAYCFVEANREERDASRMSPAVAARVVDALDGVLRPGGSILVHVYGGEPLTNLPAIRAMVERAKTKAPGRLAFGITTNGTVTTDEAIELLGAGDFEISLSIDGPAHVHDACRRTVDGRPTHAVVLQFLQLVRERTRCRVRGSSVIRPGWGLADACGYLKTLGVDTIKAQVARVPPGSPFALSTDDRANYLFDIERAAEGVIAALEAGSQPEDGRFTNRVLQLLAGIERRAAFCDVGEKTFGVTPNGSVVPCILIHPVELILGHIEDDPLTWIEEGRRWRESRRLRAECCRCSQLSLCGGGCPAILPVCGAGECDFTRKECEMAAAIYDRFRERPEALLALAGIR
jgi:uncharacterized protein